MAEFCECKFNWYQTQTEVVICVLKRDQRVDNCHMRFARATPNGASPNANDDVGVGGEKHVVKLFVDETLVFSTFLYGDVKVDDATLKCTPSKIELHLPKTVNDAWPQLSAVSAERISDEDESADGKENTEAGAVSVAPAKKERPNWDKIGKEAEAEELENSDPTVRLFKKIYMGADEDARRAMMKSMYESGGTVMNTNWSEVGKKRIEMYSGRTDDDEEGEEEDKDRFRSHSHEQDHDHGHGHGGEEKTENGVGSGIVMAEDNVKELDDTQSESSEDEESSTEV